MVLRSLLSRTLGTPHCGTIPNTPQFVTFVKQLTRCVAWRAMSS
ncbi:hypothetical protein Z946_3458 [Sulfitobacter noctilucicola]|nr:hypothetical protein Z946_3458 [Sulfitobacter noctilucicola]